MSNSPKNTLHELAVHAALSLYTSSSHNRRGVPGEFILRQSEEIRNSLKELKAEDIAGKVYQMKGTVTLIK